MKRTEKTYWNMQRDCILYAKQNENIWVHKALIQARYLNLLDNDKELNITIRSQDQNKTEGHVEQKNELMKKLVKGIYRLSRKLCFFAKNTNNKLLLSDVDYAESRFYQEAEDVAFNICQKIIERAQEYINQTADYEITKKELNELSNDLAKLRNMPAEIHMITNERKLATREIKELIAESRFILDTLDDAFEGLIDDQEFLDGWFAVRKIKGRHQTKSNNGDSSENAA